MSTKMKLIAYTRKQIANMLWISEQRVKSSKKVIEIWVWSSRSQKYVSRYILKSELKGLLIKEITD
jgi:hypothetical protein